MYFIPQDFLEVGTFGVSERIVTEDFCKIFLFFCVKYKASEAVLPRWRACPVPEPKLRSGMYLGGNMLLGGRWRVLVFGREVAIYVVE